jgi:hypothetical protein
MGAYGGVRRPFYDGWLLCVARGLGWIGLCDAGHRVLAVPSP